MQGHWEDSCENSENRIKIREEILRLTAARGPAKSICPSEVARTCCPKACWRIHMQLVREIGFDLTRGNHIEVCQKGVAVPNPCEASIKGPIRFRVVEKIN